MYVLHGQTTLEKWAIIVRAHFSHLTNKNTMNFNSIIVSLKLQEVSKCGMIFMQHVVIRVRPGHVLDLHHRFRHAHEAMPNRDVK